MAVLNQGAGSMNGLDSSTSPKQAVQEDSGLAQVAGLTQGALSVFATGQQVQAKSNKDAAIEAGNVVDTNMVRKLTTISAGLNEGKFNQEQAMTLSRQALAQAMNGPTGKSRGNELLTEFSKFMNAKGLGAEFTEETQEDRIYNARIDAALKDNVLILPEDSEEEIDRKLMNHNVYARAQQALQDSTSVLTNTNAQLTQKGKLTSNKISELNLQKTQAEKASSDALTSMSGSYMTILRDNFTASREAFNAGGDPKVALQEIESQWSSVQMLISQTAGTGNEAQVTALTTPMKNLYQFNKDFVTGKITRDELQNKAKIEGMRQQAIMFASNPRIQKLWAASELVGHTDPSLTLEFQGLVANYLDSTVTGKSEAITNLEPKAQKALVDLSMSFIESDTAGTTSPTEKAEGLKVIQKIFKDMDVFSASVDNPQQLNEIVTMLADPRFGEWASANKGVPASISPQVKNTLQAYYSEPVLKDIVQNWETDVAIDQGVFGFSGIADGVTSAVDAVTGAVRNPRGPAPTTIMPLPDILEPFMTPSGLSFRAKAGAPANLVAPALKQVNKTVLPKINRLVKSLAHVEGHTDYQKVYEENYAQMLGVQPEEVVEPVTPRVPLESETFEPLAGDTIESGAVVGGYEFLGGATDDPSNWREVDG